MKAGSPVIGKVPHLKPDWLTEDNGFWTFDPNQIIDILSSYLKNWLEDSVPPVLHEKMIETSSNFSVDKERKEVISYFDSLFTEKYNEIESSINKLTPVSENS